MLFVLCGMFTACDDDNDDVAPGLYTKTDEIKTFPGDQVWVEGQVSNYVGMSSITMRCPSWGVEKVIALKGTPVVFDYSWHMDVPEDATFPETLTVTVSAKNGVTSVKEIPISFVPDTTAPWLVSELPSQVSVDFDPNDGKGVWDLVIDVADDRELSYVNINIPDLGYNETMSLSGRESTVSKKIDIISVGAYAAVVTLKDATGNETRIPVEVVVMLAEDEDPIADYDQLYIVNAEEDPADYVIGYYRYMDRKDAYTYSCRFYAPKDGTKTFFTPTQTMNGDLIGASPYVSSKILNKQGYVVPVVFEKAGYYYVLVDIANHTCSVSAFGADDLAIGCDEPVWQSGTGFVYGDWGAPADAMTLNGYRYSQETEMVANYSGDIQIYFYTAGWARVFRGDSECHWIFESPSGSCWSWKSDYAGKVNVILDCASAWVEIRKIK